MSDKSYKVGRGRPPLHTRYKPGESGNRSGRPNGSRNVRTVVVGEFLREVTTKEGGRPVKRPAVAVLTRVMIGKGIQSEVRSSDCNFSSLSCRFRTSSRPPMTTRLSRRTRRSLPPTSPAARRREEAAVTSQQAALLAAVRQDLPSFIAKCFATLEPGGSYRQNWHILHIAHQLTRVSDGELKRLIVNIPPRHLKSICVTVAYTAWVMGHDPSRKIIALSYGSELAEELARQFRTVVESDWYRAAFPNFQIKRATRGEIITTMHGSRYACGLDGSILGRGADLIVIDDPQKVQAAFSESERRKANACYDNTISTRLNDKRDGAIVLVMQRLHEDDLVGHVLAREEWEVSTIPAIAEEDRIYRIGPEPDDLHHRRAGELIQPERQDEAILAAQQRLLGSMGFAAQYQQNPMPADGNAIRREWLRYYETVPALDLTVASWDTASTLGRRQRLVGRHGVGAQGQRRLSPGRGPRPLRDARPAPADHDHDPEVPHPGDVDRGHRARPCAHPGNAPPWSGSADPLACPAGEAGKAAGAGAHVRGRASAAAARGPVAGDLPR